VENLVNVAHVALGVKRPPARAKTDLDTDTSNQFCRHLCTGSPSHPQGQVQISRILPMWRLGTSIRGRAQVGARLVGDGHG
jgi:hypothetical protein